MGLFCYHASDMCNTTARFVVIANAGSWLNNREITLSHDKTGFYLRGVQI